MPKTQRLGMQLQAAGPTGIPIDWIPHDGVAKFSQMGP